MRFGRKAVKAAGMCLALCLTVLSAFSVRLDAKAAGDSYTYTVRIFAGAQGTIDGKEMVAYEGLTDTEADRVIFNQNRVALKDNSKYYIRGIRKSGRDNDEIVALASFVATEDADYVVAYGILSDAVMYTVEYVDAAGNVLAPSETYYGNVGDRPVVAFTYIEGYQPQAYNLTGTLDRDASNNVFRFTYTPVAQPQEPAPAPTPAPVPTPTPAAPEEPAPETPAPEEPVTDPETEIEDDPVPQTEPNELEDINDPDVPLADGSGPMEVPVSPNGFARVIGNLPLAAKILIGLAAVAAVGTAWFFLVRRKKAAATADGREPAEKPKKRKDSGK